MEIWIYPSQLWHSFNISGLQNVCKTRKKGQKLVKMASKFPQQVRPIKVPLWKSGFIPVNYDTHLMSPHVFVMF